MIAGKTIAQLKADAYADGVMADDLAKVIAEVEAYASTHDVPGYQNLMGVLRKQHSRLAAAEFVFEQEEPQEQVVSYEEYPEYNPHPEDEYKVPDWVDNMERFYHNEHDGSF